MLRNSTMFLTMQSEVVSKVKTLKVAKNRRKPSKVRINQRLIFKTQMVKRHLKLKKKNLKINHTIKLLNKLIIQNKEVMLMKDKKQKIKRNPEYLLSYLN